jgi:hypothetical protein
MDHLNEAIFLENHNILPAQFFQCRHGSAETGPLRRLALALLLDALHLFQANFDATSRRCKRDFDEAREWLLGEPGSGPFALENVCFLLDIDPSRLRRWLGLWQSMKRAGRPCRVLRSAAAKPGNALIELASLQRDYEARFNIVEQAACDSENDEADPLAADEDDYGGREHELAAQITRYLNDHCFPLVRASAGDSLDNPEIIIYGFVASDSSKRDAEAIADALLANTLVRIRDAVLVRPEMPLVTLPNSNADDGTGSDFSAQTTYRTLRQYQ